jgi:hypothetical protein
MTGGWETGRGGRREGQREERGGLGGDENCNIKAVDLIMISFHMSNEG